MRLRPGARNLHRTARLRTPRESPDPEPTREAFALEVARRAGFIPGTRPLLPGTEKPWQGYRLPPQLCRASPNHAETRYAEKDCFNSVRLSNCSPLRAMDRVSLEPVQELLSGPDSGRSCKVSASRRPPRKQSDRCGMGLSGPDVLASHIVDARIGAAQLFRTGSYCIRGQASSLAFLPHPLPGTGGAGADRPEPVRSSAGLLSQPGHRRTGTSNPAWERARSASHPCGAPSAARTCTYAQAGSPPISSVSSATHGVGRGATGRHAPRRAAA